MKKVKHVGKENLKEKLASKSRPKIRRHKKLTTHDVPVTPDDVMMQLQCYSSFTKAKDTAVIL